MEIDVPGHQGDFTGWSDVQPSESQGRIIESRFVPEDMVDGHYSEWSDTPQGYCAQVSVSMVPVNSHARPASFKR